MNGLIEYKNFNFRSETLSVIDAANEIIAEYDAQGFDLTLRQLYYQFVARDLVPNKEREYKKLGDIVSNGRLAGLIDWTSIEDRTRNVKEPNHWESPSALISESVEVFAIDKWEEQRYRVEVWIEKDALMGILDSVCPDLGVSYFSCRGYTSQSSMWRASLRLLRASALGQIPVIFHLGDHDPSGIDMSRDIKERLALFGVYDLRFHRIALNMDQVEEHNPPPNPAKVTDSRFESYRSQYGDESWELDALDPITLSELVIDEVTDFRDDTKWDLAVERERAMQNQLRSISDRFDEVVDFLKIEE